MRYHITILTALFMTTSVFAQPHPPDEPDVEAFEGDTWLGVQLTPVPAALAEHLQLEDTGLMVRNVFRDSPADQAGILRYDVIVNADTIKVAPDIRSFSPHIRDKKPGESLTLTLIRKGKTLEVTNITLAESPDESRMELKYPDDPDVVHRKNFGLRGKILRPGPDGWFLEDLGELPDADWLLQFEGRGRRDHHRGEMDEARRVEKNGEVLHVRRLKDGKVEVRRYRPADGEDKGELKTYANMDELRGTDPEAADLLESAGRHPLRPYAREKPHWEEWYDRFFQGPLSDRGPRPRGSQPPPPEPNVKFDVQPDGEIRVQTRQEDAQLDMTFKSREEFKARAPELFRRFEAMEKDVH